MTKPESNKKSFTLTLETNSFNTYVLYSSSTNYLLPSPRVLTSAKYFFWILYQNTELFIPKIISVVVELVEVVLTTRT